MKKTIALVALALLLVVGSVLGTLAYLTSTDSATNTFTVGNGIKIKLIEQQRGENGLKDFDQNKTLRPIVGSAQGEKDEYGLPTAQNYVDKIITVKNTGDDDAWVRVYFAIPSALDDGYETYNAGLNVLHFNFGKEYREGVLVDTDDSEWSWKHDGKWNYFETKIKNVAYNVYYADYYKAIEKDEITSRAVNGVYLDKSFHFDNDGNAYAFDTKLTVDFEWNNVSCPVFAVATQAAGFDSAAAAITEAFGAQYNPWGGEVTNWQ